ncbi:hypothetical protein FB45DRAFT_933102 [Roridomyces roridus]|uniref:Protein kinase domain-containing protein n=1 Tax=Roridomyces roridus TaxID=1738132 RepID=A0AAD7BDU3_9AGAR|nr:hypothetical protein FB45DRAFT_933102 [Roridomyces roridus]
MAMFPLLHPHYSPDRIRNPGFADAPDSRFTYWDAVDAIRIFDGARVVLKPSHSARVPAQILRKYSSEPLVLDLRNHCIPVIESISDPDDPQCGFIVMPFYENWDMVPFLTAGELVDFLFQVCEGLQLMHENHNWFGDHVAMAHIMMDASPILTDGKLGNLFRKFRTRTRHPVRYYLAGFDLVGEKQPSQSPTKRFKVDPLATDVLLLGKTIRNILGKAGDEHRGFEFMHSLLADMTNEDSSKRPKMDEVVRRLAGIREELGWRKLRSRFSRVDEKPAVRLMRDIAHWPRQVAWMARGIPAIPSPSCNY